MAVKWSHLAFWAFVIVHVITGIRAQCPWSQDSASADLQSSCVCNINPKSQALSVHCQAVDFPQLTQALRTFAGPNSVIENLYVNESFIGSLQDFAFKNLKIIRHQSMIKRLNLLVVPKGCYALHQILIRDLRHKLEADELC